MDKANVRDAARSLESLITAVLRGEVDALLIAHEACGTLTIANYEMNEEGLLHTSCFVKKELEMLSSKPILGGAK